MTRTRVANPSGHPIGHLARAWRGYRSILGHLEGTRNRPLARGRDSLHRHVALPRHDLPLRGRDGRLRAVDAYDPDVAPLAQEWLALDEFARIEMIARAHRRARAELPNPQLHAVIHVIVENQIAEGVPVPTDTLQRLMTEGLTRHDAIHAMGSVLVVHLQRMLTRAPASGDPNSAYYAALHGLTAKGWLESSEG